MSSIGPDGAQDFPIEEILRVLDERADTDEDDLPPSEIARRLFDRRDGDEGGVALPVPAPHRPIPPDSDIALPLPVEPD